jgi:hypothetical protein
MRLQKRNARIVPRLLVTAASLEVQERVRLGAGQGQGCHTLLQPGRELATLSATTGHGIIVALLDMLEGKDVLGSELSPTSTRSCALTLG